MERTYNQYNLRNRPDFITRHVHSVFHGTKSISYLEPKIWNSVQEEFKGALSVLRIFLTTESP